MSVGSYIAITIGAYIVLLVFSYHLKRKRAKKRHKDNEHTIDFSGGRFW